MKILVSENAGFCGGVKAAVLRLRRAIKNNPGRVIKVLGELVHNQQVNQEFIDQGVQYIKDVSEAKAGDLIIIRAHGTSENTYKYLEKNGIEYVDATCYKVQVTQHQIKELEEAGYQVAIFGEEHHPETKGLHGHTNDGFVVNRALLLKIKPKKKVALICQSTANRADFVEVCSVLKGLTDELKIIPTFCDFTLDVQEEARGLRDKCDLMLVVGGKNSSNTIRLFEICSEDGGEAFHIQTSEQINPSWFRGKKTIGITAGASTPESVIEGVVSFVRDRV